MEDLNVAGAPLLESLPVLLPLGPKELAARIKESQVLDSRMELGFSAAHIPGSLSVWLSGIPSYAGWFLSYENPLLLVTEAPDLSEAVTYLIRMGYDNIEGYLSGGMLAWHTAGLASDSVKTHTVQELCAFLDEGRTPLILDVRSREELEREGRIPGALHIHITQLLSRIAEVPADKEVYIFCGSGLRSMIAASLLKRKGWDNVAVILGGFAGWNSTACPIQSQPNSQIT